MDDFLRRFGEPDGNGGFAFSHSREGLIVGMLSIGTLVGMSLIASPSRLQLLPLSYHWQLGRGERGSATDARRVGRKLRFRLGRTKTLHVVLLSDLFHRSRHPGRGCEQLGTNCHWSSGRWMGVSRARLFVWV